MNEISSCLSDALIFLIKHYLLLPMWARSWQTVTSSLVWLLTLSTRPGDIVPRVWGRGFMRVIKYLVLPQVGLYIVWFHTEFAVVIIKCQTEQKLQNARQNRNYKTPDRTEIIKCQTEQKLQNARQNRNYKMPDRTEITKCQTEQKL